VAILARHPLRDVRLGLVDQTEEEDRRLISASVEGVRVLCAYVPNGKTLDSPSYSEKLAWLSRLKRTLEDQGGSDQPLALCGDFNIAGDDRDVFDVEKMRGQVHFSEAEHQSLREVLDFGLFDSFRELHDEAERYSWWDYRMGSYRRNRGLRIDYVFVTEPIRKGLTVADIDREPRGWEKPSDHAPVWIEFEPATDS
jgi:exodeoxyribonuclease-3